MRDEIGGAVALAGDDDDAAGLQRHVRNQRVADHDGGDLAGQLDELGLIDIDRDGVGGGRGQAAGRPQQHSDRERAESEERATARLRRKLNDILYSGTLTSRQKRYAAEPAPDRAKSDVNV